jgi:hypothetical protein
MFNFFSEARLVPVVAGTLKRIPFVNQLLPKRTGGTNNARYCYSVWLRHLKYLAQYNGNKVPSKIAELGPGDSLGIGLAALLSGSDEYIALDVVKFWNPARNIQILKDLIILFKSKARIPDNVEFPLISPVLDDYSFPSHIVTDEVLAESITNDRIAKIIRELKDPDNQGNKIINFKIPWYDKSIIREDSLDLILSQAVMGQVDDLENTYLSMNSWLKKEGFISHTVDLKSHGFTRSWNGHWTLNDVGWKIARGGRVYAINRQPVSIHRNFLSKNGFSILYEKTTTSRNKFKKADLDQSFQSLTDEDLVTSGVFYIAQKD